jgi:hypothetical protein
MTAGIAAPIFAQSPPPPAAEPTPLPTTIPPASQRSYIGIGPAIGLSGSSTALSSGGLALFNRGLISDNLSIRNTAVIFGSRISSSTVAITLDFPIRNPESGDITLSPFIGGGLSIRGEDSGTYISPHATAGIEVPLPIGVTGLLHLDTVFPSNRAADVGLLIGVGFNF